MPFPPQDKLGTEGRDHEFPASEASNAPKPGNTIEKKGDGR
jgi:hypothetical protein